MKIINKENSTRPLRCAIYTRKSCEDGLELEYNSLDSQRDACQSYIQSQKTNSWVPLDKDYNDGGFSGGNLDRPALKELLDDIENSRVDIVVVYKIDRLSRSLMDFSRLTELFNKHNVSFVSVTQNFDTSNSMGKLMLNILLSFAQFEREMTSDRIKDKLRSQKERGMWTGGNIPFGYDVKEKKLIVNGEDRKIIEFIYNTFIETKSIKDTLILAKGRNYKFRDRITGKNDEVKKGIEFSTLNLYRILTNKIYLGLLESKKTNQIYRGNHESIIEEEQFNKVREILDSNRNDKIYRQTDEITLKDRETDKVVLKFTPNQDSNVPYLLRGLIRCRCCSSILSPVYTVKTDGTVYRYYKSTKLLKQGEQCELNGIQAQQIESIVLDEIYKLLRSPQVIANTLRMLKGQKDTDLTEQDVIKSFQSIETIWNELFPREQMEIVNNLIEEILVDPRNLKIRFRMNGFIHLLNETNLNVINIANSTKNNGVMEINIPVNFYRRGGRNHLMIPKDSNSNIIEMIPNPPVDYEDIKKDPNKMTLVKALLEAENYRDIFETNNLSSMRELADLEKKSTSHVCDIYNLNYLAPDIKKKIFTGDIPPGFSLQEIKRKTMPLEWSEQRKLWGFEDKS
ncbi:resolvase [Bacilli bacterium]|nr:resolvase [Bacilli bacterium]